MMGSEPRFNDSPLRTVGAGILTHSPPGDNHPFPMYRITAFLTAVLVAAALLSLTPGRAAAAKPSYWWTGGQAARALVAANPEVRPYLTGSIFLNVGSAQCYGQGKRKTKTFQAFRCVALFKTDGSAPRYFRGVVWAKLRRVGAGDLCVSMVSLAAVPAGCLAPGSRSAGSARDARTYVQRLPEAHPFDVSCVGNGAGFYTCSWADEAGAEHSASVTFTPARPIVKLAG